MRVPAIYNCESLHQNEKTIIRPFNAPGRDKFLKHHVIFALNVILTLTTASGICSAQSVTPSSTVKITADSPGIKLNPGFYGLMTEEINHAFDGGLYAELIQNRNFRMNNHKPVHWSLVQGGGASGSMTLSTASPLNVASPNTLELAIAQAGHGQRVGAANDGYWGIPVLPNTTYSVSFFAEGANGFAGSVGASLESADGGKVFASASVPQITGEWHQYFHNIARNVASESSIAVSSHVQRPRKRQPDRPDGETGCS